MKTNYYIKVIKGNKPVLGSLIERKSKPAGNDWKMVKPSAFGICCSFDDTIYSPGNFAAAAGGTPATQIALSWSAVPGAIRYNLERSTSADFSTALSTVYSGTGVSYNNTGLTTGTHYYYRLKAIGANDSIISSYVYADRTTA